jgi:hypothetical protein
MSSKRSLVRAAAARALPNRRRNERRRSRRIPVAVLVAAASLLLVAQPAMGATAKPSGPRPDGTKCTSNGTGARACFKPKGDKMYVKDTDEDGHSAVGVWHHYQGDGSWNKGFCRNKLGSGRWGVCDYKMSEDSFIKWWAAEYDGETSAWYEWSTEESDIS